MNVAIIGYGKMGRTRQRAMEEVGGARLVCVFDVTEPADLPNGVRFCASEEQILRDPGVDAVFICTPNHRNKPLTIAALDAGKHVFCEKPPAFTAADVEEIREHERRSGKVLMYGFNHRHHESIKKAKQVVDSGELGRLLWMRGRYGKSVDANFFQGWRADRRLVGGGILLDQGIHMLDLFLHFAGDFDEVQAMVSNLFWKLEGIEDNVFANLRNSRTGVVASLHSTMTQWRHLFSLEIFLERGHIVLNGLKTSSNSYGDEQLVIARNVVQPPAVEWGADESAIYHADTSWASEVADFFRHVRSGQAPAMGNSTDALRVMRVIEKVYAC